MATQKWLPKAMPPIGKDPGAFMLEQVEQSRLPELLVRVPAAAETAAARSLALGYIDLPGEHALAPQQRAPAHCGRAPAEPRVGDTAAVVPKLSAYKRRMWVKILSLSSNQPREEVRRRFSD